ncbi:MAG: CHRD domain-containing protein [Aestuariivirga sp.]
MAITLGSGHQDYLFDRTVPFTETITDFKSTYFTANLTGAQETPPNASTATGTATGALNLDQTRFTFTVTVTGIDIDGLQTPGTNLDNMSGFHIHRAAAGVPGGIVYNPDLDGEFIENAVAGTLTSGWDTAEGLSGINLTALTSGGTYFNVHTVAFPGGEIRGQILAADSGLDRIDLTQLNVGSFLTLLEIMGETGGSTTISAKLNGVTSSLTLQDIGTGQISSADLIFAGAVDETINGTANDDDLFGAGGIDTLRGFAANDRLWGEDGNDILQGGLGGDRLNGGTGVDSMAGGDGDDLYILDNAGDSTVETATGGTDTVFAAVSHTLRNSVEHLFLTGAGNTNGSGNGLANQIAGTTGSNILNGFGGDDQMTGGLGNDTYYVDSAGDSTSEQTGEGIDIVRSSVSYTLAANLEKLYLLGVATSATGNDLSNFIYGNGTNNVLDGGTGADRFFGFAGDDTFIVDSAGDLVFEQVGNGTDEVQSSVNHTLAVNVENLTLTGAGNINGTGNTGVNIIVGNTGNNFIDGKTGNDTLTGGTGLDNFVFSTAITANVDTITDFTVVDDTIRLDDAIFAGLAGGFLTVNAFRSGAAAADADDRIIHDSATGEIFFDMDGAGGAAQVQFAAVQAGLILTRVDFFVF